jgi:thiamine-monophosphate kinase
LSQTELGVGDDGALVRASVGCELVISTDLLVEGTHFFSDVEPESLGWKTLAVNLSDMAAMGATPRWVTLACVLSGQIDGVSSAPTDEFANSTDDAWLTAFARGFFACADRYGVDLIGGDTTRGPRGATTFSVTIVGEVPRGQALYRSGAKTGDHVWVSGNPGRAALGLAHLQARIRLSGDHLASCLEALHRPTPRVELGTALRGIASSAIDVSDGLLADLGHISQASKLSAHLQIFDLPEPGLERDVFLAGGDDYELVFTAAPARTEEILAIAQRLELPLREIGIVLAGTANTGKVLDQCGIDITPERRGFDHFGSADPAA